jgi:PKD repeat protein
MVRARAVLLLVSTATLFAGAGDAQTTSMDQNPAFQLSTPVDKQVTLTVCNRYSCSTATQTIKVLDPTPVITSALVGATTVEAGQLVNLAGSGTGQPPLNYTWKVTSESAAEIDILGAGAWWDTTGVAPGTYTIVLHLQNPVGGADSTPVTVNVFAEAGKDFYTVTPCRLLDTRQGSNALGSGSSLTFAVSGLNALACGIPASARALSVNVTVVSPTGDGFVTLYPGNYPAPAASTINFGAGQTRTNNAVLPLASDGSGTLAAMPFVAGGGKVQLVVDVNGYFM